MNLPAKRQPSRLPKRFPVGTTYVVEGRGGEDGHLRVFSRYVVLPGGQRINVTSDFGGPASPRARGRSRSHGKGRPQKRSEARSGSAKKISAGAGTTRQHRR
jgi:hypothetical protein